eukprot:1160300-Pelagomonas_calceolata.AAC.8
MQATCRHFDKRIYIPLPEDHACASTALATTCAPSLKDCRPPAATLTSACASPCLRTTLAQAQPLLPQHVRPPSKTAGHLPPLQ